MACPRNLTEWTKEIEDVDFPTALKAIKVMELILTKREENQTALQKPIMAIRRGSEINRYLDGGHSMR